MSDGAKCKRNRRIRAELYTEIAALPPGTKILTSELAKRYSTNNRHVDSHAMGNLIRELDTVEWVGHGVWRKVPA